MKPPRFIKWDYNNGIGIEYERTGECNGCGDCCKTRIEYDGVGKLTNNKGAGRMGTTTDAVGIWSEYCTPRMRRFIKLRKIGEVGKAEEICPLLINGHCSMHLHKSLLIGEEGALCLAWPIIPEHVELFKKCSYNFKEINRWKIGDNQKESEKR
jgi:hypothetical protein